MDGVELGGLAAAAEVGDAVANIEVTEEMIAEMAEKYPEPKIEVNGEDIVFDSFQDLKDSKQYRLMKSVLSMFGQAKQLAAVDAYLDMKIAEESGTAITETGSSGSPAT